MDMDKVTDEIAQINANIEKVENEIEQMQAQVGKPEAEIMSDQRKSEGTSCTIETF